MNLLTPKYVDTSMPESSCFRTPFWGQRVNGSQTLLKSTRQCFYPNFPLISEKLSWKRRILVRSEILPLILTRWRPITCVFIIIERTSSNKFKRNYLQNQKYFLTILLYFWNLDNILSNLKKNQLHSLHISQIIDYEECGYLNALKLPFQNTLSKSPC